jgi:all-trans-8'-apo-beta-carotenal 15,15'-oxygenase
MKTETNSLCPFAGSVSAVENSDYAPGIESAFALQCEEHSYEVEHIEGRIPDFIRGTYYANGPARFSRENFNYRHWLDGDGMVCALSFQSGSVHFANRFVRSMKFMAEQQANRPIFRTFGTRFQGDQLRRGIALASPVNVSVYPYGESLLAFGEHGLPWELDPVSLATRGEYTFGGRLSEVTPFSAHPKFDPGTREMFNFGVAFSAASPSLFLYRFDSHGSPVYRKRLPLPYPCSIHDFSLSPTHASFYVSPYILDMTLLRNGCTLVDSLRWQPERGTYLWVCARSTAEPLVSLALNSGYCLHHINSFEEKGSLRVDVIEYERPIYEQYQVIPNLFGDVGPGQPVRLTVDVESGELRDRQTIEYCRAPDFPSLDPREVGQSYRNFWMLGISAAGQRGRKFFDQLVYADWAYDHPRGIYQAPREHYLSGEPIFVPNADRGGAGALICQIFDSRSVTSSFLVFDPFDVAAGPTARLWLRHPIPPMFHAAFRPAVRCGHL